MTRPSEAKSPAQNVRERVIIALDVDSGDDARSIVSELRGSVGAFKIGLQLFSAAGPKIVREIADAGNRIFLDLKFHDIPNTVAKASLEAVKLGVWMFNVHAAGGSDMMRRTVETVGVFCENNEVQRPLIIGVTVLTSLDSVAMSEIGIDRSVENQVLELSRLAANSGLDGVVASSREVVALRAEFPDERFITVTPGIRSALATEDDQKRVTTLRQALSNGSNYVVIGRPILQAKDRAAALEQIISEKA